MPATDGVANRINALVGLDEAGHARVVTSGAAPLPETRRFLLGRALFLSPDATSRKPPRLLTRSNSWAQRASRAFAAELLVPADELCQQVAGEVTYEQVAGLAREFDVSDLVIKHQIENHHLGLIRDLQEVAKAGTVDGRRRETLAQDPRAAHSAAAVADADTGVGPRKRTQNGTFPHAPSSICRFLQPPASSRYSPVSSRWHWGTGRAKSGYRTELPQRGQFLKGALIMWTTVVSILTSSCLFLAVAARVPDRTGAAHAGDAKKELAALEQKMLGAWKGQIGCDGRLLFRADGTYELTDYGPAPDDSAGTWKVRWDALPPTLLLTCKTSEVPEEVGKTLEVKLIQLDDKRLAFKYADQTVGQYTRVKK